MFPSQATSPIRRRPSCGTPPRAFPGSASLPRPTARTWRRNRSGESATSPPTSCTRSRRSQRLVANLPYNIATPLVVESLDRAPSVDAWCVMVQREVADRFFATPGTKAYGAVSVLVQLVAERTGFHAVSREVFRPRPNVDSALVAFRRAEPGIPAPVKRVVEAAFAHRRKTLANSLALAGLTSREAAAAALDSIDRDPSTRAE